MTPLKTAEIMASSLHKWIADHDDRWSFILAYVGGAVLLSVFTHLFWVAMLMLAHLLLEIWRHVTMGSKHPLWESLWHVKLDIALLLFALVVSLYADTVMAAIGLGQAARGAQIISRFVIIKRSIHIFFLTVDDMVRVSRLGLKILKGRGKGPVSERQDQQTGMEMHLIREDLAAEDVALHGVSLDPDHPWRNPEGGDYVAFILGGICVALIMMSPVLTHQDVVEVVEVILAQILP